MNLLIDFEEVILSNIEKIDTYDGGTKAKKKREFVKDMANQFVNRLSVDEIIDLFQEFIDYGLIGPTEDGNAFKAVENCFVTIGQDILSDHFAYSQVKY